MVRKQACVATIRTSHRGNMLFETQLGTHTVLADVPDYMGGCDRAPLPTQLFVTSLSSCICAMVAQYCEKNGIDTTGLAVEVSYERATGPTRLTDLKVTVKLPQGDYGDRFRAIEQVAMHCPVQETIRALGEINIEIFG